MNDKVKANQDDVELEIIGELPVEQDDAAIPPSNKLLVVIPLKLFAAYTGAFVTGKILHTIPAANVDEMCWSLETLKAEIKMATTSGIMNLEPLWEKIFNMPTTEKTNSQRTKEIAKGTAQGMAVFNALTIVGNLIRFAEPSLQIKIALRLINAIMSTTLLDYFKDGKIPRIIFLQVVTILFVKSFSGDISMSLERLIADDPEAISEAVSFLINLMSEALVAPAAGVVAGGLFAFGGYAANKICDAANWAVSSFALWGRKEPKLVTDCTNQLIPEAVIPLLNDFQSLNQP
jgi:hypothetical protein